MPERVRPEVVRAALNQSIQLESVVPPYLALGEDPLALRRALNREMVQRQAGVPYPKAWRRTFHGRMGGKK